MDHNDNIVGAKSSTFEIELPTEFEKNINFSEDDNKPIDGRKTRRKKEPLGQTNGNIKLSELEIGDVIYDVDANAETFARLKVTSKPEYNTQYDDWEFFVEHILSRRSVEYIMDEGFSILLPSLYDFNVFPQFEEL